MHILIFLGKYHLLLIVYGYRDTNTFRLQAVKETILVANLCASKFIRLIPTYSVHEYTLTPMRRGRGGLRATGERGADTCLGGQPDAGPGIGPRRFTHVATSTSPP